MVRCLPCPRFSRVRNSRLSIWWLRLLVCVLLPWLVRPVGAQIPDVRQGQENVEATVFVDREPLVAGQTATLAVVVTIAPGYHIQSARPLERSFIATRLKLPAVPGLTFGTIRYPKHRLISVPSLTASGQLAVYEGTVSMLVPVTVSADAGPGRQTLQLVLRSQACDDKSCSAPSEVPVTLPVTIAAAGTASVAVHGAEFAQAQAQGFLEPVVATSAPATAPAPAGSSVEELTIIEQRQYHPANGASEQAPFWKLMLLALGGGAILNIMPCVLPVIPLKVLALVQQAHGNRRRAIVHALVFSAGIVTLFVALAAMFGVLRALGGTVFYGQQFQSPLFLIAMSLMVLALALSMLGVWTIAPPSAVYRLDSVHSGYGGSFSMGLLATLLATPCSAPLLGPVLAWALVQKVGLTLVMFGLVGVGMAVPYVVLAAFPAGLDRLPRAGRWSDLLKQFLGLVMIGVAVYLLFQLPASLWPWAFSGALVLAMVCWGWGQIPTYSMERGRIWGIRVVVVALGLLVGGGVYGYAHRAVPEGWQAFSIAALDEALAQKRPVVVDFTASWCINCRAVEAGVLQSQEVEEAFKWSHALLLRADMSARNPPVEALLAKLQSRSIPVLAIFSPDEPLAPVVLRDIYSREQVISAMRH